jgi:hypothetical protein
MAFFIMLEARGSNKNIGPPAKAPGRRLILFWVLAFSIGLLNTACSDQKEPSDPRRDIQAPGSFTFFNIGRNTIYSDAVRDDLRRQLGNDAIEGRSLLDLSIEDSGVLQTHLPTLHDLNRRLNQPSGERVDHDTVKLMYRYARKKGIPFDYVAVVFSGKAKRPLLIRIEFERDEAHVVDTLEEKYGKPQIVAWSEPNGRSLIWSRGEDVLIVSLIPDQFGRTEYRVDIYFAANIEALVETEEAARAKRERERARTGSRAF